MTKKSKNHKHEEEVASSEQENTVPTSEQEMPSSSEQDVVSEKENATSEKVQASSDEIHTKAYKKAVEEGKISENETMEEKTSFWQSGTFQWIIWIVGVAIVGGIFLFQKINTPPVAVNPTDATITFEINGQSHTLQSGGHKELKLSYGEHTVTMNGQEVGKFTKGWLDGDAIINPVKEGFVQVDVPYTTPGKDNACDGKLKNNTITVEGEKYEGPFEYIEPALYVKKTWDFAPWENSSSTIKTKSRSDCIIKKELYMIGDFMYVMQE